MSKIKLVLCLNQLQTPGSSELRGAPKIRNGALANHPPHPATDNAFPLLCLGTNLSTDIAHQDVNSWISSYC